jgi:hypothetical protein
MLLSPSKLKAHKNNIKELSSYVEENTTLLHYKDKLIYTVRRHNRCLFRE